MCSALIMINILIFALPMSTTQVVISGLAAITLIYLPQEEQDTKWFGLEILFWVCMPMLGLALAYMGHFLVRKYIYEYEKARRRVVVLIPYYITFCSFIMFFMTITKNYNQYNRNHDGSMNLAGLLVPLLLFPFFALILSRYYMLRRGRQLNKISVDYFTKQLLEMDLAMSTRCPDFMSSLRFWDNKPLLYVYFDD